MTDLAGRNIGLLQLTREGRDFRDYIETVRQHTLVFLGLLSLLLLGSLVFGLYQVLGRNFTRLVRSMARIERGERRHRADVTGPREIRQLAEGMNAMLNSLERSEKELSRQREEQAQLEIELQQSQKMAAIGQLAAGVAHELGTPLSVVSGKAQRMLRKRQDELSANAQDELEEILNAVGRTERIVRQLLDFGRQNPLRKRTLEAHEIMHTAVTQLKQIPGADNVEIRCTCTKEARQCALTLEVDPIRIEQALTNLLRNAVQAAGPGGVVEYGWFEVHEDNTPMVGFYVGDRGPGIAPEIRSRLFEPFFTTKGVGEGTGLGLAVAQAAAVDHAGSLMIGTSELGGALFTLLIPVAE
ncbi:MAG: HAMP domain-containing protein [Geobacteraceae bacterium]|nr:HAMP domain-containing protein [Geobacteraceae bacterium]